MSTVLGSAASAFAKNKAQNVRDTISDSMSKIDWEDYNYPPCLHVIHYNLNDVEDETARQVHRIAKLERARAPFHETLVELCTISRKKQTLSRALVVLLC